MSCRALCCAAILLAAVSGAGAQTPYAESRLEIGLTVSDLERSLAFYRDALGMQPAVSFEVDEAAAHRIGLGDDGLEVMGLRLTDAEDAPILKLVRAGHPAPQPTEGVGARSGLRYLTFFVTELEPLLERLRRHDVPVLAEGPVRLGEDRYIAVVADPDGVLVELIGPLNAAGGR